MAAKISTYAPQIPFHLDSKKTTNPVGIDVFARAEAIKTLESAFGPVSDVSKLTLSRVHNIAFPYNFVPREAEIDLHYGTLEAIHVELLEEVLSQSKGNVLDLGCAQWAHQKVGLEQLGEFKKIVYMDYSENVISTLQEALSEFDAGNSEPMLDIVDYSEEQTAIVNKLTEDRTKKRTVKREFVVGSKEDLKDFFEAESVDTVVRLGVFEMSDKEAKSLADILNTDGTILISNNIVRQPPKETIDVLKPYFSNIECYMGNSRYTLIVR